MEARYLTDLEWRICHAVNIYVFRNGQDGQQPVLVHIPPAKKKNMKTVMNVIQDRVRYPVGYAKYLYRMDGTRVKDPCELEMYNNYVVASNFEKNFKCAAYGRKRSPLIVLNRESKHVRVLRLQNQNYYEWLLKKKAVGEERPPYIFPPMFTNENKFAKDLPTGQMGNYNPGEVQAPGCCYPPIAGKGSKTFRTNQNFVVNTVTVDVPPQFLDAKRLPRIHMKKSNGGSKTLGKSGKHSTRKVKLTEPTPSDILNANVIRNSEMHMSGASFSISSETDDHKNGRNHDKNPYENHKSSHLKTKVRRDKDDSLGEYRNRHQKRRARMAESETSVTISSEDLPKEGDEFPRRSTRRHRHDPVSEQEERRHQDTGVPPPPSQFRDISTVESGQNEETSQNVDRTECDQNGNIHMTPSGSFFYSPQKLAEINSSGDIQPIELSYGNVTPFHQMPQQVSPRWTIVQPQPAQQPQMVSQMYTIETPQNTVTVSPNLVPIQGFDTANGNVVPAFLPTNHAAPLVQQQLSSPRTLMGGFTVPQSFPSQQTFFPGGLQASPRCFFLQNTMPGGAQVVTVPNSQSQNHLQQVYQLGIIQQPDPQNCIQVDAKAMRQYVDNQKLIDHRFQQSHNQTHMYPKDPQVSPHRRRHKYRKPRDEATTESELEIPFTPLKTYRLQNRTESLARSHSSSIGQAERAHNPSRYRNERLAKNKSRNVSIQMGYPASERQDKDAVIKEYFDNMRRNASYQPENRSRTLSLISDTTVLHHHDTYQGRRRNSTPVFPSPTYSSLLSSRKADREKIFPPPKPRSDMGSGRDFLGESNSVRFLRRAASFKPTSVSDHSVKRNYGYTSLLPIERPPLPLPTPSKSSRSSRYTLPRPETIMDELTSIPPPKEFGFPLHETTHLQNHNLRDVSNLSRNKYDQLCNDKLNKTNSSSIDRPVYPPHMIDDCSRSQYKYGLYP